MAAKAAEIEIEEAKRVHHVERVSGDRRAELLFRLGELYETESDYLEYCLGDGARALLVRRNAERLFGEVIDEYPEWTRAYDARERLLRLHTRHLDQTE